jgi:hypothetical protein
MSKPIKSTLELAMEKAAKLPELTPEEIRERLEKEYTPLGRAIAERFLRGDLAEKRLQVELAPHEGERGQLVRKAFAERMGQSIDLEDAETTARVLEGAEVLVGEGVLEETGRRLDEMSREYEGRKQRELAAAEESENARLRDLGISGSAIRANPQAIESWRQRMGELQREFRPKLEEIRRELVDQLLGNEA